MDVLYGITYLLSILIVDSGPIPPVILSNPDEDGCTLLLFD
jgi:hypothetical protein